MATLSRTALRLRHLQACRTLEGRRGLHASMRRSAATNFSMPALSPTMTEGTIGAWKVKEGDSFSAGDVILEIETDKAQMDVEAPDDGVLAKILVDSGSKNVKVGTRIAVLAEPGDDISSLEIPADDAAVAQESAPAKPAESVAPKESKPAPSPPPSETPKRRQHPPPKVPFTPSPSVAHLLKEHGITDFSSIPASGPKGRLLKGDILAHLGKVHRSYPQELSDSVHKLEKLDLSNIKIKKAEPKPQPQAGDKADKKATKVEVPQEQEVTVPLSLETIVIGWNREPLDTKVKRALQEIINSEAHAANQNLPSPATTSQIFEELLGGHSKPSTSSGTFQPSLVIPSKTTTPDVYDVLTGKASAHAKSKEVVSGQPLLSVKVRSGEDPKRALEFLQRLKVSLENQKLVSESRL